MKKRLITLTLALIMACSLAIPAGAAHAEQTPEELYQGYLRVIEEVNEEYGMNVSVDPLAEMDTTDMPTVEEVREDAIALSEVMQETEAVMAVGADASVQSVPGVGDKSVVVYPKGSWDKMTFKWRITAKVTVNTPTGTPDYYFEGITNVKVVNSSIPSGYYAKATGILQTRLSSDKKTYTVQQTQEIGKGNVHATMIPRATFTVKSSNGSVTGTATTV